MGSLYVAVTHWFSEKYDVPYFEGTDGFLSSRSRLRCLFFVPLLPFARFGVHVGAQAPPAGGDLSYADISPSPVPNLQFRSMFCNADPSRIQGLEEFAFENFERICKLGPQKWKSPQVELGR